MNKCDVTSSTTSLNKNQQKKKKKLLKLVVLVNSMINYTEKLESMYHTLKQAQNGCCDEYARELI